MENQDGYWMVQKLGLETEFKQQNDFLIGFFCYASELNLYFS